MYDRFDARIEGEGKESVVYCSDGGGDDALQARNVIFLGEDEGVRIVGLGGSSVFGEAVADMALAAVADNMVLEAAMWYFDYIPGDTLGSQACNLLDLHDEVPDVAGLELG